MTSRRSVMYTKEVARLANSSKMPFTLFGVENALQFDGESYALLFHGLPIPTPSGPYGDNHLIIPMISWVEGEKNNLLEVTSHLGSLDLYALHYPRQKNDELDLLRATKIMGELRLRRLRSDTGELSCLSEDALSRRGDLSGLIKANRAVFDRLYRGNSGKS